MAGYPASDIRLKQYLLHIYQTSCDDDYLAFNAGKFKKTPLEVDQAELNLVAVTNSLKTR